MGGTYQTDEKNIGRSFLSKFLEVRDHLQDLGIDVTIILQLLTKYCGLNGLIIGKLL
jgi:hypothetical protein